MSCDDRRRWTGDLEENHDVRPVLVGVFRLVGEITRRRRGRDAMRRALIAGGDRPAYALMSVICCGAAGARR